MGAGAAATTGGGAHAKYAHLLDPNRKWNNNRRLIVLHAWLVLFLITSSTNGFDGSMMNGLQIINQWKDYFGNPSDSQLGLLNAIQNIGALAAYPFAPYVSDGLGRRRAVAFGAFIMIGATILQTASTNSGMFIGARFLIGFGLTFAANAAPMLVTETSYPTYRAPITSMYNSLWYSGAIIAAWTTYGTFQIDSTWAWRIPSLMQGVPALLQILLVWWAPESPRWLVGKGREEEALSTLAYYHADGNKDDPLVRYEFEEIKTALDFDKNVVSNIGWSALWKTQGNRKRMVIIIAIAFFSQWSGNGLVSYYLGKVFDTIGITDEAIKLLINGILQIWNLCWAIAASLVVDKIGRRILFISSCLGMLLFFILLTICSAVYDQNGTPAAAHSVIAFIFLFYASYDLAFTPLIVSYTLEILPYHLRAKGFNVFNFVISCALIFNQYVNPIALGKLGWKYYIVYCVWLAVETAFCYFFIVETKNLTLEETAALFDGEDASQAITDKAARDAGVTHDLGVSTPNEKEVSLGETATLPK